MVRGETVKVGIRSPRAGWGRVRHSWYIYRDITDYLSFFFTCIIPKGGPTLVYFYEKHNKRNRNVTMNDDRISSRHG